MSNKSEDNYNRYKTERIMVKEMVRLKIEKSWKEFGEQMERNAQEYQKLFYKTLKTLRNNAMQRSFTSIALGSNVSNFGLASKYGKTTISGLLFPFFLPQHENSSDTKWTLQTYTVFRHEQKF